MRRVFKKDQILTIPNLLSVIRLLMIPVIVWLYMIKEQYGTAVFVIFLSGLTDVADGIIARKFHMVSDFGKILDPVADKLTQFTVIVCLTKTYDWMMALVILFFIKEICMAAMGYVVMKKKDSVNSAKWYGKLNTVVLYLVMAILILFPKVPEAAADGLILFCGICMLGSLLLYARFYSGLLKEV